MERFAIQYQYAEKADPSEIKHRAKIFNSSSFTTAINDFYSWILSKEHLNIKIIFCIQYNNLNTNQEFAETCQYKKCSNIPTCFAYSRSLGKVGAYCQKHSSVIQDEGNPEYVDSCELCGCAKGVN